MNDGLRFQHPTRLSAAGVGTQDDSGEDDDDDRDGPFASVSMEEHRSGQLDVLPPPYSDYSSSTTVRHSQSAGSGLDGGGRLPGKIPSSRTTDGGLHLNLSTTAPTKPPNDALPFTSPKSMETHDDLSRSGGGNKL